MKPIWSPDDFQAATTASSTQITNLRAFYEMVEADHARFNLVGPSVLEQFWRRHAFDSAQLVQFAPRALRWADLGAGAGFPGIILAIMLKDTPGALVHLVESQQKRTAFLSAVVSALQLPAMVHPVRAESFDPAPRCDIVTARACAPLGRLLGYAQPFIQAGAEGLFLKGMGVSSEIEEARRDWRIDPVLLQSLSHEEGQIVRLTRVQPKRPSRASIQSARDARV